MVMAMQIGPNGSVGIEVFASVSVLQPRAPSAHDDDRLAPEPIAHLGERMPEMLVIKLSEAVHRMKPCRVGTKAGR